MSIKVIRACDTHAELRMRARKRPPSLLHSHCSKVVKNTSLAPKAFSFFTNNRHFCEAEILIRNLFFLQCNTRMLSPKRGAMKLQRYIY